MEGPAPSAAGLSGRATAKAAKAFCSPAHRLEGEIAEQAYCIHKQPLATNFSEKLFARLLTALKVRSQNKLIASSKTLLPLTFSKYCSVSLPQHGLITWLITSL